MWDRTRAVAHLDAHAQPHSHGRCAQYVRKAVEAGGVRLAHHTSAKDYGPSLTAVGFQALAGAPSVGFQTGDVAVIQPVAGHPHGHIAMYDGTHWVSDFTQQHGLYPGPGYRSAKPAYTVYRNFLSGVGP